MHETKNNKENSKNKNTSDNKPDRSKSLIQV